MSPLRAAVARSLPPVLAYRLRAAVRRTEQFLGRPFAGSRPGAVCTYHVGRCGSSVLGEMLGRHPRIRWDGEIFHHAWVGSGRRARPLDAASYVRRHLWAAGRRWYGFELKFLPEQHLAIAGRTLAAFVDDAEREGVTHHVILERRNALRRMISAVAGVRTGRRHAPVGEPQPAVARVRLHTNTLRLARGGEPRSLVACLDEITAAYDDLRDVLAERETLHLTFEEDVAADGPTRGYRRICDLLGLEPENVAPYTRRLHALPVHELLENPDEVAAALRGTPHEWMLTA